MVKRKGQANISTKTLHRKLKIEQHEDTTKETDVHTGALEGSGVPALLLE